MKCRSDLAAFENKPAVRVEDELRNRGKKLGEVGLEELDDIWNALKAEDKRRISG